jgi:hypothetical protein
VSLGERNRLVAPPLGDGERPQLRCETELREAADFKVRPTDLPGEIGALLEVAFTVFKPQGPRLDDPQVHQSHRT